jgi:hypothetical protein
MEAQELLVSSNTSKFLQKGFWMFLKTHSKIHLPKIVEKGRESKAEVTEVKEKVKVIKSDSWFDKRRVRKAEKKYGDKPLVVYEYEYYDRKGNITKRWTEKSPDLPWCDSRKYLACCAESYEGYYIPFRACARVILPEGISEIPEKAFISYTSREMYDPYNQTLGDYENIIKNYRFLREIVLPESLEVISRSAFAGCKNLIKINFPSGLTSIENYAFIDCESLQSVDIPTNINYIGCFAFEGCKSLKSISIPKKIKVIEWGTFRGCRSLQTVTIPNSVTEFQEEAFQCCKINSFNIPQGTTIIGKNAFSHSGLKAISIPGGVENISDFAFYECCGLESVSINEGTKRIFMRAFFRTDLKEVIIPESVISIGEDAFAYCMYLRSIVIKGRQTQIYDQSFLPHTKTKIIVPTGTKYFYCEMLNKTQQYQGYVPPVFEEQEVHSEVNSEQ